MKLSGCTYNTDNFAIIQAVIGIPESDLWDAIMQKYLRVHAQKMGATFAFVVSLTHVGMLL